MLAFRNMRAECRPPISRRRNAKIEKGDDFAVMQMAARVDEEEKCVTKKSLNPQSTTHRIKSIKPISKDQLIKDLDSNNCDSNEVRNLKELLLVNLDLIQQQQELLSMREKQIEKLKSENNNLRGRLERMDRRMGLIKTNASPSHIINGSPSIRTSSPGSGRRGDHSKAALKRKSPMEPHSLVKKFVTIAQNDYEKEQVKKNRFESEIMLTPQKYTPRKRSNLSHFKRRSSLKSRIKNRYLNSPRKISSLVQNNGSILRDSRILRTRHSLGELIPDQCSERMAPEYQTRERSQSPLSVDQASSSICTNKQSTDSKLKNKKEISGRKRGRPRKLPKDENILKTLDEYFVQNEDHVEEIQPKKCKSQEEEVLVPSFRIRTFTPYYVIDGRENFEDEVYIERHRKPENEEKKRKRWDLQQQREEEQRRKLLASNRYQDMTVSSTTSKKAEKNNNMDFTSLLPDPANIEYIEVCEELPVSVFGYPLPNVNSKEFTLPWFDIDKREKDEGKKLRSRKR